MIAFLDASALIYLVEGTEPFHSKVKADLARVARRRPSGLAISRLSWLECRVRPQREKDEQVLAAFDSFFGHPDLTWVELTRDVVELATAIRVRHGLRTADALQAACCFQLGPEHEFLTGEKAFRRVFALNVRAIG